MTFEIYRNTQMRKSNEISGMNQYSKMVKDVPPNALAFTDPDLNALAIPDPDPNASSISDLEKVLPKQYKIIAVEDGVVKVVCLARV